MQSVWDWIRSVSSFLHHKDISNTNVTVNTKVIKQKICNYGNN